MPEDQTLLVSPPPHVRADANTRSLMLDVVIALSFAMVPAVLYFGWRSLALTLVSVASCLLFEGLYRMLTHKPRSLRDLSAVVTGMLIAYGLPVSAPYWLPVVGSFFAIVVVKQLYGGLGKNFLNPALAARVFLVFSWPVHMTTWIRPFEWFPLWGAPGPGELDAMTAATPLSYLNRGILPDREFRLMELLLGERGGTLGEICAAALLLGGLYLLTRKVISFRIPLVFIGTAAILTFVFSPGNQVRTDWMLYQLLSGSLILGAFFMATDYVTSPVTIRGQWFYGIGCGLLVFMIRTYGIFPEGVSFAILFMNACVWFFDKTGMPHRFGTRLSFLKPGAKQAGRKGGGSE
jgi:electron transport complex protein RnfD